MMDGISNKMDLQGLSAVRSFAFLTADLMLNITNKNGDNHEYKVTSSHVNNDKLQGPKGILKATKITQNSRMKLLLLAKKDD